jgi:hypothetical protein
VLVKKPYESNARLVLPDFVSLRRRRRKAERQKKSIKPGKRPS